MTSSNLVTCGDNIKIWDSSGYSLLHQFQPNNTNDDVVTDVCWSRDGSMVASVVSRQALLVVTGVSAHSTRQLTAATDLPKATCCRFCTSNSRYICVGSHSGGVDLWDNKNGKLVKQYQGHQAPVTRVCFSGSDRHVASASRAGHVLVHNVTSGVVTELPAARSEPQCARDLRYSAVRPAVLGAAFDTGHVSLWDVNQRRLLHTFTGGHVAPAAGLAFSPVNDILLASVGLDKRLVCYDPKTRNVIQRVVSDAPLTAVDFHGDGVQLAVGTSQGRVCVYDLRAPGRPSRAFTAHRSSVQRVQFQPPAKVRGRGSGVQAAEDSKTLSSGQNHSLPAAELTQNHAVRPGEAPRTHSTPVESAKPSAAAANDSSNLTMTTHGQVSAEQSSLFSPLRDESRHTAASPPTATAHNGTASNGTSLNGTAHGRDSSLFSPVRGDLSLGAAPAAAPGRADAIPSADGSLFPPLRLDASLGLAAPAAAADEPRDELGHGEPDGGAAERDAAGARRPGPDGCGPDGAGGGDASSPERPAARRDGARDSDFTRDVLAELAAAEPSARAEPRKPRSAEPAAAPAPVPHSVLERLEGLHESIDDMWWGMRRENFNTQWSVGKHMYEVKAGMESMAATIRSLQAEVLRLREENQYLGCKF